MNNPAESDMPISQTNTSQANMSQVNMLETLLSLIEAEHQALRDQDHAALLAISEKKQDLMAVAENAQPTATAGPESRRVNQLAAECQRQNLINGVLINKLMATTEKALEVLYQSGDKPAPVYSASGAIGSANATNLGGSGRFKAQV